MAAASIDPTEPLRQSVAEVFEAAGRGAAAGLMLARENPYVDRWTSGQARCSGRAMDSAGDMRVRGCRQHRRRDGRPARLPPPSEGMTVCR